ncbi:MAG: hypothetical protein JW940_19425 [Polyangiaceae bacterium]|nr:hypothetical protein [Polyangiaceae bacterium]
MYRSDDGRWLTAAVSGRARLGVLALGCVGMLVACGGSGCLRDTDCASDEQCTMGACVDRAQVSDGGANAGGAAAEAGTSTAGQAPVEDAGLCPCEAARPAQEDPAGSAGAGGSGGAAGSHLTDVSIHLLAGTAGSAGLFGIAGLGGDVESS